MTVRPSPIFWHLGAPSQISSCQPKYFLRQATDGSARDRHWSLSTPGQHQGFGRCLSLYSPKMQRVPEVLQLSVIVKRARPLCFEPQPSQEFNLVSGHVTAERSILKEFSEPRLVL